MGNGRKVLQQSLVLVLYARRRLTALGVLPRLSKSLNFTVWRVVEKCYDVLLQMEQRIGLVQANHDRNTQALGLQLPTGIVRQLSVLGKEMGQSIDTGTANLGLGHLYYALTRIYRPDVVVCIGSYRGFAPVCFALGLVANQKGVCIFIDPGKVDDYWHDPAMVEKLDRKFGLQGRLQHILCTTQEVVANESIREPIDLLYIDGDHRYAGVKFDFDHLAPKVRPEGLVLFHDSIVVGEGFTPWEVKEFLEAEVYGRPGFETFTFPFAAGLTLVRKTARDDLNLPDSP
jgi:predicted O-methyltransferase YrrM